MLKVFISSTVVLSVMTLIILLTTTTPVTAGPLGILVAFLCAYILLIISFTYLLHLSSRIISHLSMVMVSRRPLEVLSMKKSYYYSTILGAAPIMLIGLQSVGSIGFYEIILIIFFVLIGCLYISKK